MNKTSASDVQLKAISHNKGPARILAGPGSGKTYTIIRRILNLTENLNVEPDKILVVTFTKAAALEMRQRYQKESSMQTASEGDVHFGTFHSICYHILKESGGFCAGSFIKESEKRKLIELLMGNCGLSDKCDYDTVTYFLDYISRTKNLMNIPLPEETGVLFPKELLDTVREGYQSMMKEWKRLDYDDMIAECLRLLSRHSDICRKWQKQFRYILVDEFQDINESQYQVIRLLAMPENNLFVVGDDDQSIYGFRGASPEIMKRFLKDYPDAFLLLLSENYRSCEKIVTLAGEIIAGNKERVEKQQLPVKTGGQVCFRFKETRKEEEEQLIRDIKSASKDAYHKAAVILRTNREAFQYKALLKQRGIPLKERVKDENYLFGHFILWDIKRFLCFVYEGNKRSDFLSFMNKPNRFLTRQALVEERVTEETLLRFYGQNNAMKEEIRKMFRDIKTAGALPPHLCIRYFRKVMGYDRYLKEKAADTGCLEDYQDKAAQAEALFKKMKAGETVEGFLKAQENQGANGRNDSINKDRNCQGAFCPQESAGVSVLTMHGVKGLEFDCVYLPDVNEGIIPGRNTKTPEAFEEERRLLYVAVTRAEKQLYIYYTKERNRKPSRFLEGIIPPV